MYGILTDDRDVASAVDCDEVFYFSEQTRGTRHDPLPGAVNSIACWGDTETVRSDPSRAAVTEDGTRATPETPGHHWGTVCPSDQAYREALLERIETAGAVGDVRLTTLGFPGEDFCHCERCADAFQERSTTDREEWRAEVITSFVANAASRIDGDLLATLYPDPYPGNLHTRAGLDPAALDPHVDGFHVPLCSIGYETTYWVESLARGFAAETADLDASLWLQLSASEAAAERLADLTRIIEPHADGVVYGTHRCDVALVEETIDRLREDPSPTVTV